MDHGGPHAGLRRQHGNQGVARAVVTAHEIAVEVEKFARRIEQLRALAAVDDGGAALAAEPERSGEAASSEALRVRIQRQNDELTLALEELRAQNDALGESQEQLEVERARYADLFDNAPDAYVTTDRRGVVHEANVAAASLLGMAQRAMRGRLLIAFVARRDTRPFRQILAALPEAAATYSLQLRARDGTAPFRASLSMRRIRRAASKAFELRWTIRRSDQPDRVRA